MSDKIKNLLIVDDDHLQTVFIKQVFREIEPEVQVESIDTGEKLLGSLQSRFSFPSLILLDFQLSGESGIEVLQQLKQSEQLQSIPVIVFSGHAKPEDVKKCYELKAASFMKKPHSPEGYYQFAETICFLLDTKFKVKQTKYKKTG